MPDMGAMEILETPVLELLIRGAVVSLVLMVLMRITGQSEAGGLRLTDVLLVVLIAEAVTGGLIRGLQAVGIGAVLAARPGRCCVELRAVSGGASVPDPATEVYAKEICAWPAEDAGSTSTAWREATQGRRP
ncbi:hypothetical protein ACFYO2_45425 [Streptomyces sp. NPDC006602]|uniref:hypothetical protein n=1 Tax=Streptomyces sp. NPDC006602 TaxID=3364751 RepID=UPI0036C21B22